MQLLRSRYTSTDYPSETERSIKSAMTLGLKKKTRRRKASSDVRSGASETEYPNSAATRSTSRKSVTFRSPRGSKSNKAAKRPTPTYEETETEDENDNTATDDDDDVTTSSPAKSPNKAKTRGVKRS